MSPNMLVELPLLSLFEIIWEVPLALSSENISYFDLGIRDSVTTGVACSAFLSYKSYTYAILKLPNNVKIDMCISNPEPCLEES